MAQYANTAADVKRFRATPTEQNTQYSLKKMQSKIFVLVRH